MSTSTPSQTRRGTVATLLSTAPGRVVVAALALLVVAAVAVPRIAFVRLMSPQPSVSGSQLSQAPSGTPIRATVRLESRNPDGSFGATFLEPEGSNRYRATGTLVRIRPAPDMSVAMGGSGSLKPGAVLQVSGRLGQANTITAQRATVLTGFVSVGS
jgi:hypothetical protein